ncbi:hypothetical protein HO173_000840 [Letharia columbiana]|uniref:Uncharacterized protein n=1 Tax=Letharia columbiana TaxID=112416 RepID=A0A8H6G5X6_9LECA|nr:uncharacterized protein HO173_000840 [Letharia columbiana]KAF6241046.1 hypothetical protein HO173_000840 [Letharia columbiana]
MRRILRRNQAATRPPSSRTRLSSPRSHVIYSPRFRIKSSLSKRRTPLQLGRSTSNHYSASGEHHCNLAYHPHYIEEQEEELQQANAENTAEKPSGNKATIVKNTAQLSKIPRHMLSTVPHQIITQQAENTTATWPTSNITHHTTATLRSKRRNYNRQMRRTLRRNQAATRPPSSRTRLSSPRSHVISVIHSLATQSDTLQEEEQEEELQQANAENTAEKPSGNKAPSTKNTAQLSKIPRHMLSTVPYQIITQQAENTTAT